VGGQIGPEDQIHDDDETVEKSEKIMNDEIDPQPRLKVDISLPTSASINILIIKSIDSCPLQISYSETCLYCLY